MYSYLRTVEIGEDVRRSQVEEPPPIPPEPRLQVSPQEEWLEYRRNQLQILNSYGWISRETGTVRIPIQRAIELMALPENRGAVIDRPNSLGQPAAGAHDERPREGER
jgi:hypothetical protein